MRLPGIVTGLFAVLAGILAGPFVEKAIADEPVSLDEALVIVPAVELDGDPGPTLEMRMRRYGVVAVSLARIEDFELVERSVVGTLANGGSTPATPDTQFQAASISKPVAAFAVMSLVDDGLVDLDAPANSYLESWRIPELNPGEPVTVRDLLSHTSGLGPRSYPGLERGTPPPSLTQILDGAPESYGDPVSPVSPKGAYAYSGGGYMVLQALIQDVTGQPFESYLRQRVFDPAGMTDSSYALREHADGASFGHDWTGAPVEGGWAEYPQAAAAGLWSSPTELANLLLSYMRSYRGEAGGVVSPESARLMAQPVVQGMGLGFGVDGEGEARRLSHAGWSLGYRAYLVAYPETGDGIVIMTNGQAGHHLIDDVLRTYGRSYGWPGFGESPRLSAAAWSEARLEATAGRYGVAPAGFEIELKRRGSEFELITARGSRYRVVPTSTDRMSLVETGDAVQVDWNTGTLTIWGMSAAPLQAD